LLTIQPARADARGAANGLVERWAELVGAQTTIRRGWRNRDPL